MKNVIQQVVETMRMLDNHTNVIQSQHVGSLLIDGVEAKDIDFLVLMDNTRVVTDARWAFGGDWVLPSGEYSDTDDTWCAIRKGDINLILTNDARWYERCKLANEVCVALQVQDKKDRIRVYRVIRDGKSAEEVRGPM